MSNAITLTAKNGNKLTLSAAVDARIVSVNPAAMVVTCKSNRAAAELTRESRAWGTTAVMFDGP
jgi:hypothetical protein